MPSKHVNIRIEVVALALIGALALVLTAVTALPTQAQQPAPTITPTYVGTATSPSGAVVLNFLQTLDYNAFNPDAELTLPLQDEPVIGRDPIAAQLGALWNGTFTNTWLEVSHAYFMDGTVIVEFLLHGVNTGPLMTYPATNLPVDLPMIGVFELQNGLIQNLRLYFDLQTAVHLLGLDVTPTAPPPAPTVTPSLTHTPFTTPSLLETQPPLDQLLTQEATEPVMTEEPPDGTEEPGPVGTVEPTEEEPPVVTEEPGPVGTAEVTS